jgi:hypothetical protein
MVASNPMTHAHPDANGNVTLITNESARQLAGLFTIYASTLLMLMQYFDFSGESDEERVYLRNAIRQTMSEILRPIAEILTTLPVGADAEGERAGPGFDSTMWQPSPTRPIALEDRPTRQGTGRWISGSASGMRTHSADSRRGSWTFQ